MPAPQGNSNAAKGTEWRQAIQRALSRKSEKNYRAGLDMVADELVDAALNGDRWAIEEIGNRADGKPMQCTEISGPDGEDIPVRATVLFVRAKED